MIKIKERNRVIIGGILFIFSSAISTIVGYELNNDILFYLGIALVCFYIFLLFLYLYNIKKRNLKH